MKNTPVHDINVGNRLRKLHHARGYSIRLLAEKSGLNANTLSLIENQKTSPSVSTLQQIPATLQVPITAFFESEATRQNIIFQKAAQRTGTAFTYGSLADMGAGFSQSGMQTICGDPGSAREKWRDSHCAHRAGVRLLPGRQPVLRSWTGRNSHWRPATACSSRRTCHTAGGMPERSLPRSLLLLCSADERDHPDERHFS